MSGMAADGSRSPSRIADDSRATKRAKIYQACYACQRRKSRCEGLTAAGCARCITIGKSCSLAIKALSSGATNFAVPTPDMGIHPLSDNTALISSMLSESQRKNDDLQGRMERAEERIRQLNVLVARRDVPDGGGAAVAVLEPPPCPADNPLVRQPEEQSQVEHFNETFFGLNPDHAFPHPIKRGIVTQLQADVAFQVFKHHFSLIIPLEQFLSTTSPTPTHGFLLTAILQHVSRALPETLQLTPTSHAHLDDLLQQSLFYILAGTGSEEVILGLLVLSLATTRKGEWEYRPRPSALRLVSLAFQIGSATGLAAACRASLTLGEDLKPMWMRAKRNRMQLWIAIANRHFLLLTMHTCVSELDWSIYATMTSGFDVMAMDNADSEPFRHLYQEYLLIRTIGAFVPMVSHAENKMVPAGLDVQNINNGWEEMRSHLDALRKCLGDDCTTRRQLLADSLCAEFSLGLRMSACVQRVPSPVAFHVREALLWSFGHACADVANKVNSVLLDEPHLELSDLPEYITILLAVAVVVQLRGVMYVRQHYPGSKVFDMERMEAVADRLQAGGGTAAILCRQIRDLAKQSLNTDDEAMPRQDQECAAPVGGGLPDDFFNFDFFGWDPSLMQYQDMLETVQKGGFVM